MLDQLENNAIDDLHKNDVCYINDYRQLRILRKIRRIIIV